MIMKKKLLSAISCSALFVGLGCTAAHADSAGGYTNDVLTSFTLTPGSVGGTFNFSFSGPLDSGSGVFTTSTTGTSGEYLITGISGTTDGSTIASLFPVDTFPQLFGGGDNLLFAPAVVNSPNSGSAYLDISGVAYALTDGLEVNLYYGQFMTNDPEAYDLLMPQTPEPPSLLLLATGGLGLFAFARRVPSGGLCRIGSAPQK